MDKLEVATQILAGMAANPTRKILDGPCVNEALRCAQALIDQTKTDDPAETSTPSSPN